MTEILQWTKGLLYELHQAHFLIEKRLAEKLTKAKRISFSQFLILMALSCSNRSAQCTVAEYLYLTEATVSRHVRTLMKNGLVKKHVNPKSRREFVLSLTPKGKQEMAKSQEIIDQEIVAITKNMSTEKRESISVSMKSLLAALSTQ